MPSVRGVYTTHPTLLVPGLWFDLSTEPGPGLVGRARATWAVLIPATGTDEEKRAGFETTLNSVLQGLCETTRGLRFRPASGVPEFG